MMKVFLRPQTAGPELWDAWYGSAGAWHEARGIHLAQLHDLAASWTARPLLLLPTQDLFVIELAVDQKQAKQGRDGLRFLIEDQVSCDLEELHIILGHWDAHRQTLPLMAVQRASLSTWLEALAACAIEIDQAYADALVLAPGSYWHDQEQAWLACSRQLAYVCAYEHLPWLQSRLAAVAACELQAVTAESWSQLLERTSQMPAAMNFMQGDFKPQVQKKQWDRSWLQAMGLTLVAVFLLTLDGVSAMLREQAQIRALARANLATYQQLFPGDTRIVNLALQIEGHLNESADAGNVLSGVHQLASIMHELSLPAPEKLSYDARSGYELDLAADPAAMVRLQQSLQRAGWTVQISSGSAGLMHLQFHS